MNQLNRRNFLIGSAWMGAAVAAAGCMAGKGLADATGAPMHGFKEKPFKKVRVGIVGVGCRGTDAVHRLAGIPGVEVAAICDIVAVRLDMAEKWLKENGKPTPRRFTGSTESYRALCAWEGIDVVYVVTPWQLHAAVGLAALEAGKYALIEVPSALTIAGHWWRRARRTGVPA